MGTWHPAWLWCQRQRLSCRGKWRSWSCVSTWLLSTIRRSTGSVSASADRWPNWTQRSPKGWVIFSNAHQAEKKHFVQFHMCLNQQNCISLVCISLQEPKRNASTETTLEPLTPSPESPTGGTYIQIKGIFHLSIFCHLSRSRLGRQQRRQDLLLPSLLLQSRDVISLAFLADHFNCLLSMWKSSSSVVLSEWLSSLPYLCGPVFTISVSHDHRWE